MILHGIWWVSKQRYFEQRATPEICVCSACAVFSFIHTVLHCSFAKKNCRRILLSVLIALKLCVFFVFCFQFWQCTIVAAISFVINKTPQHIIMYWFSMCLCCMHFCGFFLMLQSKQSQQFDDRIDEKVKHE